jgi:hypothetical protein
MGSWGLTWVRFTIFALVITLIPYREYERWAWYMLWLLPLLWLSHFVFSPDLVCLMHALVTTVGLVLPYQRVFFRADSREEVPSLTLGEASGNIRRGEPVAGGWLRC